MIGTAAFYAAVAVLTAIRTGWAARIINRIKGAGQ